MTARIVINPEVCGGRPIVAGTRMRVSDVLDTLASGVAVEEMLADFPYLTREDVSACLAYGARAVDGDTVQITRRRRFASPAACAIQQS